MGLFIVIVKRGVGLLMMTTIEVVMYSRERERERRRSGEGDTRHRDRWGRWIDGEIEFHNKTNNIH